MCLLTHTHVLIHSIDLSIYSETTIETDFSGTTFVCAVIRDNSCTIANIGDSRTSLAYRNASGGITAVQLTIDHKPDLPAEKARIEGKGTSKSIQITRSMPYVGQPYQRIYHSILSSLV